MYYVTTKLAPYYHQVSLDDLLSFDYQAVCLNANTASTKTYEVKEIDWGKANVPGLINVLRNFNETTDYLREKDRHDLYSTYMIPKRSGGYRQIDAPVPELKTALSNLKLILETSFGALYHTCAFAYVKNRSTLDCVKRHQKNDSKWFEKEDLSNFFGSTTLEFTIKMLGLIFPFCAVLQDEEGKEELTKALELGFLDGVLPQGTPLSPTLTNIIMIPIDFTLSKTLRSKGNFVYTRYADDFYISSMYTFDPKEIKNEIKDILNRFGAPYKINEKKSIYGSVAGSNWILGLMLNKEGNITVGYKNKKLLKAALFSYARDKVNGVTWELDDIRTLEGKRSYYQHIEGEVIDEIVNKAGNKFNIDIVEEIKKDLQMYGSIERIS